MTALGRAKTVARLLEPAFGEHDGHPPLSGSPESFVAIDARDLAQQVCERIRARADAKDVDLFLNCTCGRVWVQRQAFSEALYQLLDNAVQATRRGYPVMVDVHDTSEGDVLWQIQDTGEGMPERVLAKLGEPPQEGSSGLGVALAWAIIERHGGLLRFESAPRVGTTASVWLPGRG